MRGGLDANHILLGIHSNGNECITDGLGFLNELDPDGIIDVQDIGLHQV